jgi:RES domain
MIGALRSLSQADTVRLLPSARLKEPALKPLVDSDHDLEELARLESVTHGRMRAEEEGLAGLSPRELVFGVPNQSFINAAFVYTRPDGNRFNDGNRGAWYCGFEVETSLDEVAYHLTRALADADDAFDNVTDYAELYADFNGAFQDIRGIKPAPACLHDDPAAGYPAGQALARDLIAGKTALGVVYPSVRHRGGTCLAAFHPYVVQNVRQGGLWRMTWSGTPTPDIARLA